MRDSAPSIEVRETMMELPKKSEQADELAAALGRKHETQLASLLLRSAISGGSPKASSADLELSRLSGSIVKKKRLFRKKPLRLPLTILPGKSITHRELAGQSHLGLCDSRPKTEDQSKVSLHFLGNLPPDFRQSSIVLKASNFLV